MAVPSTRLSSESKTTRFPSTAIVLIEQSVRAFKSVLHEKIKNSNYFSDATAQTLNTNNCDPMIRKK